MKFRSILLTVLTFLALLSGTVVQAQDDMGFDTCSGLSEADCAVISEASENGLGDATSFTVDISLDFTGSELSGLFGALAAFGMDMDLGSIASVNDLSFAFDGTFDVAMDEENETGSLAGSFTTTFALDDGDVTEIALDVIVLEDFAYINDGEGWKSIDLERLAESEIAAGMMGMTDMMGMGGDDEAADGEEAANPMGDLEGMMDSMSGLLEVPGFITNERAGDDFVFAVDFTALQLLLTDDYTEMYTDIITTASETDPTMAFLIPTILTIIEEGNISIVQTVDTDANIISAIGLDASLSVNLAMLTGEATTSDMSLTANIAFSNLDGVSMAEAPADAVDGTDDFIAMIEEMMPAMEETEESDG